MMLVLVTTKNDVRVKSQPVRVFVSAAREAKMDEAPRLQNHDVFCLDNGTVIGSSACNDLMTGLGERERSTGETVELQAFLCQPFVLSMSKNICCGMIWTWITCTASFRTSF